MVQKYLMKYSHASNQHVAEVYCASHHLILRLEHNHYIALETNSAITFRPFLFFQEICFGSRSDS